MVSEADAATGSQASAKINEGSIPEHSVRCCLCHDVPQESAMSKLVLLLLASAAAHALR